MGTFLHHRPRQRHFDCPPFVFVQRVVQGTPYLNGRLQATDIPRRHRGAAIAVRLRQKLVENSAEGVDFYLIILVGVAVGDR